VLKPYLPPVILPDDRLAPFFLVESYDLHQDQRSRPPSLAVTLTRATHRPRRAGSSANPKMPANRMTSQGMMRPLTFFSFRSCSSHQSSLGFGFILPVVVPLNLVQTKCLIPSHPVQTPRTRPGQQHRTYALRKPSLQCNPGMQYGHSISVGRRVSSKVTCIRGLKKLERSAEWISCRFDYYYCGLFLCVWTSRQSSRDTGDA
jgi:hypothetical protein